MRGNDNGIFNYSNNHFIFNHKTIQGVSLETFQGVLKRAPLNGALSKTIRTKGASN